MKITEEQLSILSSFTCERLSTNEQNRQLIQDFESSKGKNIVKYLKEDAWDEDSKGISAVYLIKSSDGIPCMYFALKCGALYRPLDEAELRQEFDDIRLLIQEMVNGAGEHPSPERVQEVLEELRQKRNISAREIIEKAVTAGDRKRILENTIQLLEADKAREGVRPIQRVKNIYPGVEITHLCTNDNNKAFWGTYGFRFPMGAVLFWHFIAPKLLEIQNVVGCQYAFLFAADSSVDGNLTNYYNIHLKFTKLYDLGTSKPFYDFCCEFMSQDILSLKSNIGSFFDNFNLDPDDVIA